MNDSSTLKGKVEENLFHDARLADFPIEVLNNNGIITLAGQVPSEELSEAAAMVAKQTDGVTTVINEIVVNKNAVRVPRLIIRPS